MSTKRILIADDEALVLRVLRLPLEKAGYEVETVNNGEKALARETATMACAKRRNTKRRQPRLGLMPRT